MAGYLADNVDEWIYIDIADQHEDSMRSVSYTHLRAHET